MLGFAAVVCVDFAASPVLPAEVARDWRGSRRSPILPAMPHHTPLRSAKLIPTLAFALIAALASVPRLHAQADVRNSQIAGNMPPADSVAAFITRDVNRYFQLPERPMTLKVDYEFLSPRVSQTGVGSPKLVLWVRVSDDSRLLYEGAMKVAAIEQKEFEVLWFSTLNEIRTKPADLEDRFPAALIPRIIARAARAGAGPAK